jgi:hypothetical protein
MRKQRVLAVFIRAVSMVSCMQLVSVAEARPYGKAGCGLGSLLISPSGNQTSAATTNATGYQTFAITSGTSNCVPGRKAAAMLEQERFITANLMSLSKEIAQGEGETLASFAGLLGCEESIYGSVASRLQASYATIFAAPGAISVLDTAKAELRDDVDLAASCRWL